MTVIVPHVSHVQLCEINPEIIIDFGFYFVLEGVLFYCEILYVFIFQIIHKYFPVAGIYNPVFTDSGIQIKIQFPHIVMFRVTRGNNFNNPVRRTCTASVCKLLRGAYDAYIRLNRIIPVYRAV